MSVTLSALQRKLELVARGVQAAGSEYHQQLTETRVHLVTDAYLKGAKSFLKRVKTFGTTERGSALILPRYFEELLSVIGDLRIAKVYTTGPAQVGKTLSHTLFLIDCVACCKLNVGWFYNSLTNLNQNVPRQFRPIANAWISKMKDKGCRIYPGRTNINSNYQVDNSNAVFSYVSTSRPELRKALGGPAAGGAAVSVQLDILILEERSQYEPGSADSLPRRLDASCLPNRVVRELGTLGCGNGIESNLKVVDYYFYPHFDCDNCGRTLPLDPKGCLLQQEWVLDPTGRKKLSFFSESGRPIKWFCEEPDSPNAVKTAYFGCPNCGYLIRDEQRYNASFRCQQTGIAALEFIKSLPPGLPPQSLKVAMHMSPLTRKTEFNLAAAMVEEGLTCVFTEDWQQQMLGHISETSGSNISLEMLKRALVAPVPEREPDMRLVGIDEGRGSDWITEIDFYLPFNYYALSIPEIIEQTIRVVQPRTGAIRRDKIVDALEEDYVEYGLIDNEPSRESAMRLCRESCLEMANQVDGQRAPVKKTEVEDGGIPYPCWDLRNEKFMTAVLEGFLLQASDGHPLYRLPADWKRWIGDRSDKNPLTHLSGPHRDTNNRWHRGPDNLDDIYFAAMFAEAAFYLKLTQLVNYGEGIVSAEEQPMTAIQSFVRNLD